MMLHRASAKTKPINSAMSSNFGTNITNKPFESATSLSSSSSRISIPALPPLNSDSSGTYSLFSSTSSVKLRNNSNLLPSNKSYHESSHHGIPSNHDNHGNHAQVIESMGDPMEQVLGPFPCARLRGLPIESSVEDVLVFFQGLVVLDVVLVHDSYSHGQGEAFVVFANPMDFQMALQRTRQSMGHRYIEVYQGKRMDYYAAIASKFSQHQDETGEDEGYGSHGLHHMQGNVR